MDVDVWTERVSLTMGQAAVAPVRVRRHCPLLRACVPLLCIAATTLLAVPAYAAAQTSSNGVVAEPASRAAPGPLAARTGFMLAATFNQGVQQRRQRVHQSDNVFDRLQHQVFSLADVVASHLESRPPAAPAATASASASASASSLSLASSSSRHLLFDQPDFGNFYLSADQLAYVSATYSTKASSLKMRDQSPRFGPSEPKFVLDDGDASDPYFGLVTAYVWGVALCLIIGVGVAIGQFLLTGCYMFWRCCCWRWICKKRSEHEHAEFPGYLTPFKKYWPVVFTVVFILLACAFSIVGIVFNNGVSSTFSDTNQSQGIGPLALQAMTQLDNSVTSMQNIIADITIHNRDAYVGMETLFGTISAANSAASGTAAMAASYGTTYGAPLSGGAALASTYNVTVNGTSWNCGLCSSLGLPAQQLSSAITTQVVSQFSSLSSTVSIVQSQFFDVAADINNGLIDASDAMDSATSSISGSGVQGDVTTYSGDVADYDKYRNIAFVVLFCLVFITPVLAFLAIASKKGWPFKCNFCLGPFYLFLIWLLFGLHWMLGMFIGDGCTYMDSALLDPHSKLTLVVSSDEAGTLSSVINACLVNASMITALNLSSELAWTNQVSSALAQLPTYNLSTTTFQFDDYTTLATTVNEVTPDVWVRADNGQLFNYTQLITQPLAQMSSIAVDYSGGGTCAQPGIPNTGGYLTIDWTADLVQQYHGTQDFYYCYGGGSEYNQIMAIEPDLYWSIVAYQGITQRIAQLDAATSALQGNLTALQPQLTSAVNAVTGSSGNTSIAGLLQPIFADAHRFEAETRCGSVAVVFKSFKDTLCNELQNNIQWITLALFVIGVSCFPITWCSRWSSYRVQFVARVAPAPFDEGAWMNQGMQTGQPQYDNGIQMVPMDGQGQTQDGGAFPQGPGLASQNGEATYGDAVAVPPYQAALAAYTSIPPEQHDTAHAQHDGNYAHNGDQYDEQPMSPSQHGSPDGAAGTTTAAEEAAATFQFGKCASCEQEPAMVKCVECEESLCLECDNSLHIIVANANHDRTMLA